MSDNSSIDSNDNNDHAVIISTSSSKPVFPYMSKFMSLEYEEIRTRLNEVVLALNVAYKYYPAENKPTSPWKKLYESLYNPTNGLFSTFKIPSNSKPIQTMKKKLFDGIYPEMKRLSEEIIANGSTPPPSLVEGSKIYDAYVKTLFQHNQQKEEEKSRKEKQKEEMRAVASTYKINVDNVKPEDKLEKGSKYLSHSTNLSVNKDPSTAAAASTNTTPETKAFSSIQNSMSLLNNFLGSTATQLMDITGDDTAKNTMTQTSVENDTNQKRINNLKRKIESAKEAYKFAVETGNEERALKKRALAETLEDELEKLL